jgi:hypothetical protein
MAAIQQMLIGLKPLAISSTTNLLISANTQNYVLNTAKVAGYVPGSANVVLTINSGIYVGSSSIATPSLIIAKRLDRFDTDLNLTACPVLDVFRFK